MSKYKPLIAEYLIAKLKLESNLIKINEVASEHNDQIKEYERVYKVSVNFYGPEEKAANKKLAEIDSEISELIRIIDEKVISLSIDSLTNRLREAKAKIITQINIDKLDNVNKIDINEAIFLNDEKIAHFPLERFGEISCNKRMAAHNGSGYFKSTDDERKLEETYRTYPNEPKVEKIHVTDFEWLKGYLIRERYR